MLLGGQRNILEIWSKVFGDLEKNYLAIFGENVSVIWRNRSATLERTVRRYWREPFGDNVGVLEKRGRRSYVYFILEIIME